MTWARSALGFAAIMAVLLIMITYWPHSEAPLRVQANELSVGTDSSEFVPSMVLPNVLDLSVAVEEAYADSATFTATPEPAQQPQERAQQRFFTVDEFYLVLARTPWSVSEWATLWEMFAGCEATASGEDYKRLFFDDVPRLDAQAEGDRRLARGGAQIRVDAWPHLVRTFDLFDLRENLIAAYIVWIEVGREYSPTWSCAS